MSTHLDHASASPEEQQSALFANLVLQQTNMALLFLGKMPGPEGNEVSVDLSAASMFIDTLGVIEARTQGNLTARENEFLRQNLTTLRMYFAEAVRHPVPPASASATKKVASPSPADPPPATAAAASPPADDTNPTGEAEATPKRFTKKYTTDP